MTPGSLEQSTENILLPTALQTLSRAGETGSEAEREGIAGFAKYKLVETRSAKVVKEGSRRRSREFRFSSPFSLRAVCGWDTTFQAPSNAFSRSLSSRQDAKKYKEELESQSYTLSLGERRTPPAPSPSPPPWPNCASSRFFSLRAFRVEQMKHLFILESRGCIPYRSSRERARSIVSRVQNHPLGSFVRTLSKNVHYIFCFVSTVRI